MTYKAALFGLNTFVTFGVMTRTRQDLEPLYAVDHTYPVSRRASVPITRERTSLHWQCALTVNVP